MALTLLSLLSKAFTYSWSSWNEPDNGCRALWQPLYHHQLLAQRLPRPTLVFWRFWAVSRNIALLLAIIALPVVFLTLDGVVPGGRRRVFPVLLLLPILFLLFLASRLDGLIGVGQSGSLAVSLLCYLGLRFLGAGFFGSDSLGLHLQKSIVRWAMASRTTGIWVPDHDARS